MKKLFCCLCASIGMLFVNDALAQKKYDVQKTEAAIAKGSLSQMDIARFIEYSLASFQEAGRANIAIGLRPGFHYETKNWEQADVTSFADCPNTFDIFENLLGLANAAVETKDGAFTDKAIQSQNALSYLKPDSCKTWKGFGRMIGDAAAATQATRDNYRRAIKSGKRVRTINS